MSVLKKCIRAFVSDQAGVASVEIVVLLGATVTLGILTLAVVGDGLNASAKNIEGTVSGLNRVVQVKAQDNWFGVIAGASQSNSGGGVIIDPVVLAKETLAAAKVNYKSAKTALKTAQQTLKMANKSLRKSKGADRVAAKAVVAQAKSDLAAAKKAKSAAGKVVKKSKSNLKSTVSDGSESD